MLILYVLCALLLGVSLLSSRRKTAQALRIALRRFVKIAPAFLIMLVLVAVVLCFLPDRTLGRVLARENRSLAIASALGLGSVSIMPGFIAFPLCGVLLDRGALYTVLSAFSTTPMMVGVVTFPVERAYLGVRLTLIRNVTSLGIAVVVALATGQLFGELP